MPSARQSNFELLRIFSMVLIAMHHFSVHGVWPGGIFSSDVALAILAIGGKLGVDLFVMITGYMTISSRFKTTSLLRVVLQTLFYSAIILAAFMLLKPSYVKDTDQIIDAFMPTISGEYWFVTAFVGLLLFSPFLRILANRLGKSGLEKLLLLSFAILSVIPVFAEHSFVSSNLVWFFFLFLLAGYMRLYCREWSCLRIGGLVIASFAIVVATAVFAVASDGGNPQHFAAMNSPFLLALAIGCFKAFQQMNIGLIKPVNALAGGSFAVYLIHDNPLVRKWLWPHFSFAYDFDPVTLFALGVATAVGIYLVCSIFDILRQSLLEKPLFVLMGKGIVGRALDRVDAWFNALGDESAGTSPARE